MKKWNVLQELRIKNEELRIEEIIILLLNNRGIISEKDKEDFLNPKLESVTPESVGIDTKQLAKTLKRIQKAIENKEKIVVFGDYDVDGIAGTAILWETLYGLGADVMPYIPHRVDEGYGLSIKGIQGVILNSFQDLPRGNKEMPKPVRHDKKRLIITVDNGIVASDAVEYANGHGIDVIITDHHTLSEKVPKAHSIVHTTKLCGTGVAYLLSQQIPSVISSRARNPMGSSRRFAPQDDNDSEHLALVALATVADLVPLTGANRTLLKFGLEELRRTKRIGLLALFKESGIDQNALGTYEIGHIIAPRLNAMGRLEYAMDSLRLLCTRDRLRAQVLADTLGRTNKERQLLTQETVLHALTGIRNQESHSASSGQAGIRKLLFIAHESYQPGVIGLVAGKLVEEFYRPAIVLSKGEVHSKASARSIAGFNIIEFIRMASEFLVDAGGHPMAAGFTIETAKIPDLQKRLMNLADGLLDDDKLLRTLRIDCELMFPCIDTSLHNALQKLTPFGMGNPEPTFVTRNVKIEDMRIIGKEGKHLKFKFQEYSSSERSESRSNGSRQARTIKSFEAIAFGFGSRAPEFKVGGKVDIVYTVDENIWNGNTSLQLKIKDIKNV